MKPSWPVLAFSLALAACGSKSSPASPADASTPDGSSSEAGADAGDSGTCPSAPASDPLRPQREACTFPAGAKAADTLGVTPEARAAIPIKHVIVLMKENRSFDFLFGKLSTAGQPDAEPVPPTWASADAADGGAPVSPFHATRTCPPADPPHQWTDMHMQYDDGKMDGFVKSGTASKPPSDGHFTMSYLDGTDIPFYYWLANTYAIADHYFPSVMSGTWSNRDYLVAATSNGTKNTSSDPALSGVPLIFDKLDDVGVSWQVYTDDLEPLEYSVKWDNRKPWAKVDEFKTALAAGTLPAVSFVDANTSLGAPPVTDEHPPADVQVGEAWTRAIYDAVVHSPSWSDTAFFFVYDEAGGFGDHVPPPKACVPSPDQADFNQMGFRVPLIVVSPWARRHFVSHAVHEHTSILRFIEVLFDVPALTARDANSDALLDMFDFACPNSTPIPDAPAAGTGGCK